VLESTAKGGNSPVSENDVVSFVAILEYPGTRIAWGNPAELTAKAKYVLRSIVN